MTQDLYHQLRSMFAILVADDGFRLQTGDRVNAFMS